MYYNFNLIPSNETIIAKCYSIYNNNNGVKVIGFNRENVE